MKKIISVCSLELKKWMKKEKRPLIQELTIGSRVSINRQWPGHLNKLQYILQKVLLTVTNITSNRLTENIDAKLRWKDRERWVATLREKQLIIRGLWLGSKLLLNSALRVYKMFRICSYLIEIMLQVITLQCILPFNN